SKHGRNQRGSPERGRFRRERFLRRFLSCFLDRFLAHFLDRLELGRRRQLESRLELRLEFGFECLPRLKLWRSGRRANRLGRWCAKRWRDGRRRSGSEGRRRIGGAYSQPPPDAFPDPTIGLDRLHHQMELTKPALPCLHQGTEALIDFKQN